jgi:signal transduction histidine kinase
MAGELIALAHGHLNNVLHRTVRLAKWTCAGFVIVSAGLTLGCWAGMHIVSRRIVKPILALSDAAKAMARGDLTRKVEVSANDEIGDLCAAFNEMAEDLRATTTSIENLDREIHERRQTEEALRNETRLSRLLLDSMPCIAILVRPHSREIVAANRAASTAGAVPGKICFEACFQRSKPCAWCLAPEVWSDGQDRHVQIEHQGTCWDAHWLAVSDDLYLHYAFDVTAQRRAELERENLAKFPKENPNPVLRMSNKGVVLYANNASLPVLQTWGIQQGQKVPDNHCRTIRDVASCGRPRSLELACRNGRIFTVTLTPVTEAGYVNAYGLDVTERRKAEDSLDKLNRDLESANLELTRTNKELQEFAHVAAHDLKTPLRAIGTLADWIAADYADKFDEEGKEQVRLLVTKAKQMTALIDDILHYSSAGQSIQKSQHVDLNVIASQVISGIAPPEHIEVTAEKELPTIVCKKTHVTQILQNLLGNAIKYMDKARGHIRIGCVEQEDFWKFSVADNGPGIDARYFEKIFEIFQTLAPRDGVESTGIGLSIVKKLVELNNGRVWLESQVGKGSTFFFTLPKQEQGTASANACPPKTGEWIVIGQLRVGGWVSPAAM